MFKKVFLASMILGMLSLSGGGAQSSSLFLQAGSFVGLLISLIIIFIFMKMIMKSVGCLPSMLILGAIIVFIMYAFGMLNNGLQGIPEAVQVFLGQKKQEQPQPENILPVDPRTMEYIGNPQQIGQPVQQAPVAQPMQQIPAPQPAQALPAAQMMQQAPAPQPIQQVPVAQQVQSAPVAQPMQVAPVAQPTQQAPIAQPEQAAPAVQEDNTAFPALIPEEERTVAPAIAQVAPAAAPAVQQAPLPEATEPEDEGPINLLENLPIISGPAKIINADTLSIRGRTIKLFGIDAPEANQTCSNQRNQPYKCGREAVTWLQDWLSSYEIDCRIMKQDKNGTLLGVCMLGDYDIAAALVNAGLAFAYKPESVIYVDYETQAQVAKRGLWRGTFYYPWDWRKMQAQKPNFVVIKKKKKKGLLDSIL